MSNHLKVSPLQFKHWYLGLLVSFVSTACDAQDAGKDAGTGKVAARFVPDDALAVIVTSPNELLASPALAMFPVEVYQAQSIEISGIDPLEITQIKLVVGVPGPSGPQFAAITQFENDVQIQKLLEFMNADPQAIQVGDHQSYRIKGPPGTVVHQLDGRTLIVASADYLDTVIQADNGSGPLPALAAKVPHQTGITALAVLEQIRPLVSGVAKQQVQQLPPPLQPLGEIPELVDAILIQTNFSSDASQLKLSMLCGDENAASRVVTILMDSLSAGREIGIAEVKKKIAGSGQPARVNEATEQYANRIADMVMEKLTPSSNGRRVDITIEGSSGIATTGVLVGLLLPAVQSAREAARRMNASNNIKQIMLALHNYHAMHNQLPAPAITDADGKPLLSWRVAILPFVDELNLYEQFRLDEPWDSEHNLPLSRQMPAIYVNPSVNLDPGLTVFQAAVGETFAMKPEGSTKFRDIIDGLSHTILIVESSRHAAVVWSKPEDINIDLDNPLANMGDAHPGGFHVGMGDGAVKFIASSIDLTLFRGLLTRAGLENITGF